MTGGRQTTNKGQTASNEDPVDIQVEDDDVDLKEFQEKGNNEDEKVPTEQNKGNKRRHRGDRTESRKEEREKVKGEIWDRSRWIDPFCNRVDELIILN
jgi:hypothetical protein